MFVVLVKYDCAEGKREAFLQKIREMEIDRLCREEDGNHKYEYSYSTTDPDVLFLTEIWEDSQALARHAEAPHYKKLGQVKAEYVLNTSIDKYEVK